MNLVLQHVFTMRGRLSGPVDFGRSAISHRLYYALAGGTVIGPAINGEILPGGGDWIRIYDGARAELDVRFQIRADDGAMLYLHYPGWMDLNPKTMQALAGGPDTEFEDLYARATPRIETGSTGYGWMNDSVFVSRGRVVQGPTIEAEVFLVK